MAAADLQAPCPHCHCPDQHVGLKCGFCGTAIPVPRTALTPDGTVAEVKEVIGYRGWKVVQTTHGPRLESPVYPMLWTPGEWMVAECHQRTASTDHSADSDNPADWPPVKGCGGTNHGCGFYAGRTREHLIQLGYGRYTKNDPSVIGRVQMQGKIIPASNGWRAQMCRPRTIYVPHELWQLARDLKDAYGPHGVEVEVAATLVLPTTGQDAIQWCRKCTAKMGRHPRCPFCGHTHT